MYFTALSADSVTTALAGIWTDTDFPLFRFRNTIPPIAPIFVTSLLNALLLDDGFVSTIIRTTPCGDLTIAFSKSGDILLRRVCEESAKTLWRPIGRPVIMKENTKTDAVSKVITILVVFFLFALKFPMKVPARGRMSVRRNPSVRGAFTVF